MVIIGLSVIKIITKQQVTVFVVIFLFCFLGFLITDYEIQIGDKAYGCEEKQVAVTGRINKIVKKSVWVLCLFTKCLPGTDEIAPDDCGDRKCRGFKNRKQNKGFR